MQIISNYINDLKNISWISYDEINNKLFYQQNSIDANKNNRLSHIYELDMNNNKTSLSIDGEHNSIPKISPNGENLAYVKKNKINDKITLNSLHIKNIKTNEDIQITTNDKTIITAYDSTGSFNWNSDSNKIAYTFRYVKERDDESEPYVVNRIRYRQDVIGWLGDDLNQIDIYSLTSKKSLNIENTGGDDTHPVFSNDGSFLAFVSDEGPTRDDHWRQNLHLYNMNTNNRSHLSTSFNNVGSITWSLSDEIIYVIGTSDNKEGDTRNSSLYSVNVSNKSISNLNSSGAAYNDQSNLKFINDSLRISVTSKGVSSIIELSNTNESTIYENQSKIIQIFDSNSKTFFIENNRNSHDVIKMLDKSNNKTIELVAPNKKFFKENSPSLMKKITIERNKYEIESRVYYPSDFNENNSYPLIVDIHGGPHGRFEDQIAVNQEIFTKSGFIVIAVNPRGSSSYGSDFGMEVNNDWGGEDYLDILESVNKLSEEKYIDNDRIGLYGYSYGGFMSSWIIGHTNKFKAAVIGAPCINLNSMSGTSDIGIKFGEEQWGGLRYDSIEKYQFNSPLTYVKNVKTPAIILVGDRDYRCPIEQAEQYFVTLKRMGNDVQLIRYPGGNHGMLGGSPPKLVIDFWTRAVNFFNKHLN